MISGLDGIGDLYSAGDYLDALRFVRILFDDTAEHAATPVHFEFTPAMVHALAGVAITTLRTAAGVACQDTDAEIEKFASGALDVMITEVMGRQAELADG